MSVCFHRDLVGVHGSDGEPVVDDL